jgi:hypothetical protein
VTGSMDFLQNIGEKTSDKRSNLLMYILRRCFSYEEMSGTPKAFLPVPAPKFVEQGIKVDFAEFLQLLLDFFNELKQIDLVTKKVLDQSSEERKQPFGTKVRLSVADLFGQACDSW